MRTQSWRTRADVVSAVIGLSVSLAGCEPNSAAIWSDKAPSPSGRWTAAATTIQTGGPGTASVGTTVHLQWTGTQAPPTLILGLENDTAYPLGITAVRMTWRTEGQLDLGYCEGTVTFQAVTDGGVAIRVHRLPEADCRSSP